MKKAFLELIYPFYTRLSAYTEFVDSLPDPVLIYQMAKVGSTAVHTALSEKAISSLHIHYVNPGHWQRAAEYYRNKSVTLPSHFHTGRLVNFWLKTDPNHVKVITLVRDPIARKLSGIFQLSHLNGIKNKSYEDSLQQVKSEISGASELNYPFKWFNNEIKPTLGIDVLDEDFNRDEGYSIITRDNISVLVLQTEKLDTLFPTVISEFVGSKIAPVKARVRKNPIYSEIKKNLNFPDSFIKDTYNQPGIKHFYSDNDIDEFVSKWSKP